MPMTSAAMPWLSSTRWRLPSQCACCRSWSGQRVCGACVQRFMPPRSRCSRCAIDVPQGISVCADCHRQPPTFGHAVVAVDYAFPWDGLVTRLKFHDGLDAVGWMAAAVARAVDDAALPPVDMVLPVPLSRRRLQDRGFNQAWELARRIALRCGTAAHADVLRRLADTQPHAGMDRAQRARSIRGAFGIEPRQASRVKGAAVAVVDDVLTTCATAAEASRTLLDAGARSVQVWAFARTPRPDGDLPESPGR